MNNCYSWCTSYTDLCHDLFQRIRFVLILKKNVVQILDGLLTWKSSVSAQETLIPTFISYGLLWPELQNRTLVTLLVSRILIKTNLECTNITNILAGLFLPPHPHEFQFMTANYSYAFGYVLRVSDQRARAFPPTRLSGQTHVCKWSCPSFKRVASERAKRTLWLVAATKPVCPLLPGRSYGGGGGSDKESCWDHR